MNKVLRTKRVLVHQLLKRLEVLSKGLLEPLTARIIKEYGHNPYLILISCLLSLRSRDTFTYVVCQRLFAVVSTPLQMAHLSLTQVEHLIYGINFYKRKAATLKQVSNVLIERFNGHVPATEAELLSLPGVGPKTSNLVLAEAFKIPAICVDTHVHRLSNLTGLVHTKTVKETEAALRAIVPRTEWIAVNKFFVLWGQNFCKPHLERKFSCQLVWDNPPLGIKKPRSTTR
jgi:endonuclease III